MINQSTLIITVLLACLTIILPRRHILLPIILAGCFVPADQRMIVFDLDFTPLRILILASFLRILLRGENGWFKRNRFDNFLFLWMVCGALIYILQWRSLGAIIYECGITVDVLGLYWLFRMALSRWEDIELLGRSFAACAMILAVFVAYELATGSNPFTLLGRVTTWVREGRYRCQASFPHSIMLGLFWATLVPVFVGCAKMFRQYQWLYLAAVIVSVFMVMATASSTPLMTLLGVVCVMPMFPYRRYGRQAAWLLLGVLVGLHLVMKAPVWHLIARLDVVGGSTGWHRYNLIDQAIKHFPEWAVLGTRGTGHWGYMLVDVTNQFVLEGVRGGILTLALFCLLMFSAVRITGRYSLRSMPRGQQWLAWGVCVSVIGHCISFFGVSYFGQIRMLLYLTFALVAFVYDMNPAAVMRVPNKLNAHHE